MFGTVVKHDIDQNDIAVAEFRLRKDSGFVVRKCSLLLIAPVSMSVSVVLLEMSCLPGFVRLVGFKNVVEPDNTRQTWWDCTRAINPGAAWTSTGRMALIGIRVIGDGLFTVRINAKAVARPEPGKLRTRYMEPKLGYIENAELESSIQCCDGLGNAPGQTNTWTHLAVPENHVVMISVTFAGLGSRPPGKVCSHRVELYDGSMNRTVWRLCSRYQSLPEPLVSDHEIVHVHYVSERNDDKFMRGIGFRLVFTYHHNSSIPPRLPNGDWNCSTSAWSSFHRHFICDLVKQCAGGEDEGNCSFYKPCGHNGALWHGTCYSLQKLEPGSTWHQANVACFQLGPGGRLAKITRDAFTVSLYTLRHDLTIEAGHVILYGKSSPSVDSHL